MSKKRLFTAALILVAAIFLSFALPKSKYKAVDIVSELHIPLVSGNWRGQDVSGQIDLKDERYNFIGEIFSRAYRNRYGEELLLLILNAGNFHNPKVCFGSSGYQVRDLPDKELKIKGRSFKVHSVYFEKGGRGTVVVYWICINKKTVDWGKQKILQLWYSLFNKEKIGLMVRMDIPSSSAGAEYALRLAQEFLEDIDSKIPPKEAGFIFGE